MPAGLLLTAVAGVNCPKTAGVKRLFTIKTSDVTSITLGSDHDITNIVFAVVGNGFGQVNFKRGECQITEAMEQQNEVIVNFAVPNPTKAQRKELQTIKNACEQYMVAELYEGDLLFIGYDAVAEDEGFVSFQSSEFDSGRAKTDANLMAFNMRAEQGELLRVLSGISGATVPATTKPAIIAELLAATSV
jgi:hypothetical protein